MNDLLRLLSKSLHPFGYHIRSRKGLNVLQSGPYKNLVSVQSGIDKGLGREIDGNLDKLIIYVRTCLRDGRNIDARPRLTGVDLNEHSLRCIYSLIQSIKYALWQDTKPEIELIVLDDHSDERQKKKLENLLKLCPIPVSFKTTSQTGQGASLHEQFSMSRAQDALVYFCEDDYLHEPNAIITLWQFYKDYAVQAGSHLVLYPQEHNTLYSNHYPSYLMLGQDRHWRSMCHATHTFLTHGLMVERYWKYFENTKYVGIRKKRKKGSEAKTTNKLFRHLPGFCPLKPCAVHLQFEELLPPHYDWRPLWDNSALPEELAA